MILSCAEVHFDNPDPSYKEWIVGTTPSESLTGILESCRKIPKLHDRIGDWECIKLSGAQIEGSDGSSWRIKVWFSLEPAIAEAAAKDEPQLPPYDGPKGQQPDGSFVLTPRCVHFMQELFLRGGSQFPLNEHVHNLSHAIYEDTGVSFMEWT